jgi:hypothetical protein
MRPDQPLCKKGERGGMREERADQGEKEEERTLVQRCQLRAPTHRLRCPMALPVAAAHCMCPGLVGAQTPWAQDLQDGNNCAGTSATADRAYSKRDRSLLRHSLS